MHFNFLDLIKRRSFFLIVFPFLCLFSVFKYSKVLFSHDLVLANSGDGLGTIAGIYALQDLVSNGGWSYLFSDMILYQNNGQALANPGPSSQFWKIISYSVGSFFTAETSYDVIAMLGFLSTLLVGYGLFRYIGLNKFIALLLCISFASMDNTIIRAQAHLFGLGVSFAPLLVVWSTLYVVRNLHTKSFVLLSLAHAFNINVNEYYGYFGVIFTIGFFMIFILTNYKKIEFLNLLKSIIIAALFFIVAMLVLYPNILTKPIINFLFIKSNGHILNTHVHDWNSFTIYTLKTIFPVFESNIVFFDKLLNRDVFHTDIWEMSYRLGIVIPMLVLVFLYTIFVKDFSLFLQTVKKLCPWFFASLLMFLFTLSPENPFSLVFVTYEIAPMFRVGLRSLLYFNIGMFIILAILLLEIPKLFSKDQGYKGKFLFSSMIVLIVLLVHNDVARFDMFNRFSGLKLDKKEAYASLATEPNGILLEIPFYSPITAPPESNYAYLANRIYHNKPIANQIYYGSNNTIYRDRLDILSKEINNLSKEVLDSLIDNGISYIAVSQKNTDAMEVLLASEKVKLLSKDDFVVIFKVEYPHSFDGINVTEFLHRIMK